jgi:predicted transcriptional regulator
MELSPWIERDFPMVTVDDSVETVEKKMDEYSTNFVVVVNKDQQIKCVLKAKDLMELKDKKIKLMDICEDFHIAVSENGKLEDVISAMMENGEFIVPVFDKRGIVSGVITPYEMLEAFSDLTGMSEPGIKLSFSLMDKPGELKRIIDVLSWYGWNILSILTNKSGSTSRSVVLKLDQPSVGSLEQIKKILKEHNIEYEEIDVDEG